MRASVRFVRYTVKIWGPSRYYQAHSLVTFCTHHCFSWVLDQIIKLVLTRKVTLAWVPVWTQWSFSEWKHVWTSKDTRCRLFCFIVVEVGCTIYLSEKWKNSSLHKRMHAVRCIEMCSFQVVRYHLRWEPNFYHFRAVDMRRFGNLCSAEWLSSKTRVALAHIIVLPSLKEMANFYTSSKKDMELNTKEKSVNSGHDEATV